MPRKNGRNGSANKVCGANLHRKECGGAEVLKTRRKHAEACFQDRRASAASAEEKQNTMKIDTVKKIIKVYNTSEYEQARDFLADESDQATNIDGWKIEYDTGEEE